MSLFTNILDEHRQRLLPLLKPLSEGFYLAGGTGLALQLGHRTSFDFDFFTPKDIDTGKLFKNLTLLLTAPNITKLQEEKNTLTVETGAGIKISLLSYPYRLLEPLIKTEFLDIASITDIGCMKFGAIISRSEAKDYIDLYMILKRIPLKKFVDHALPQKLPQLNVSLALKSLVYMEDLHTADFMFKNGFSVQMDEVKSFFELQIKNYYTDKAHN